MGSILLGGILLGSMLFYAWFVFVWLSSWIATFIVMPFSKDSDEEVVQYEGEVGMGRVVMSGVTRGDLRVRYVSILLVWPALLYLHYRFWNELYAGFKWLFEDVVAPAIAALL